MKYNSLDKGWTSYFDKNPVYWKMEYKCIILWSNVSKSFLELKKKLLIIDRSLQKKKRKQFIGIYNQANRLV